MNRHINSISNRLSLRHPQRESLEILAHIMEEFDFHKNLDLNQALQTIQAHYPTVTDFERDFPSLCFALATGVGKTRLMGAFIAYLHLAHGINHFFVLAPNLTIYNKLITDFTPNTPKYVFEGIGEFATSPPEVITGDNYENRATLGLYRVRINIFNISKINSEVRGDKQPRIKRLSEYIGQSYFDYLSGLDDLVLLMDESHRYRASAGVRVLNELKPILGLELTATPQVEKGSKSEPFKNVIYNYPLARALQDGFVKEPAVATRENFDPRNYSEEQLERIKLEDSIIIHENAKVELDLHARQNNQPRIKPFILVVAQDTEHANRLMEKIQSPEFFEGRYANRVITVHSNQRGEEKDETVNRLMAVEQAEDETEIVIHVNMLKEGWDVTNLYTIVPLRAANSRTLVEQSVGRGLRLPYGCRTGAPVVDRLTIVAHDKFQEIIDEANNPDSIIRQGVVIGRDISPERRQTISVASNLEAMITGLPVFQASSENIIPASSSQERNNSGSPHQPSQRPYAMEALQNPVAREVAKTTLSVIQQTFQKLPSSESLQTPEIHRAIVEAVSAKLAAENPIQTTLEGVLDTPDISNIVAQVTQQVAQQTIDIPRIIILPKGEVNSGFHEFQLDLSSVRLQPVDHDILIQHLSTSERDRLQGNRIAFEDRLENYLVRWLIDYDDISYDDHRELLYNLSGQVIIHLQSYLADEEQTHNVLLFNDRQLAALIHTQMQDHYWEEVTDYEATVSSGFMSLQPLNFDSSIDHPPIHFRQTLKNLQSIRKNVFGGFTRCVYPLQKFDADTERRFAILLEDDQDVLKWFKPGRNQFKIYYRYDSAYEPDFVVETRSVKYLCEPKMQKELQNPEVQAKAKAAVEWCQHATKHAIENNLKPWSYLLIPHDAITANASLSGLASLFIHT
jgi:type III restriction enzyme